MAVEQRWDGVYATLELTFYGADRFHGARADSFQQIGNYRNYYQSTRSYQAYPDTSVLERLTWSSGTTFLIFNFLIVTLPPHQDSDGSSIAFQLFKLP
ncbi:hypothetical protein ACTXT7_012326 [Hymenolepis weldensis]